MQKPAAYRPSVLVLLAVVLVLMKDIGLIPTVGGGDQHSQVCIPPGSNGRYSVNYNHARLPVEKASEVQDYVLREVSIVFTNAFKQGRAQKKEFCSPKNTYSAVIGSTVDLFSYAYCDQGIDRQGCIDCLRGGVDVIKQNCGDGCYGAQASSDSCCIRFEGVNFC